jgi:UDP-N-acetylmuramyl pentapeptide phosphotransferase/UDP-N-acetylglucosamine-1-phosphate transferase
VQLSIALLLALLLSGFAFSAALVAAALRYSATHGLLDQPGQRRSHRAPTPRGGGIGIVIAFLAGLKLLVLGGLLPLWPCLSLAVALLLVAGVGWLDDHRSQPVLTRLLVQSLAALLLATALLGTPTGLAGGLQWGLAIVVVMTAINFCNFLDGANGMLSLQVIAVAVLLMLLAAISDSQTTLLLAALLLATVAGFLPFNFPRARIFLGDVGSGALGLLIAALGLIGVGDGSVGVGVMLCLTSAFWLDTGLTLAWRFWSGRRWYQAHRQHLYQWLLRRGWTHVGVSSLYLGWTLLLAAPLAALAQIGWISELAALTVVAVLGAVVWLLSRRWVLRQAGRPLTRVRTALARISP